MNNQPQREPDILISDFYDATVFTSSVYGWEGVILLKYLINECRKSQSVTLSDKELKQIFGLGTRTIKRLKDGFRANCIVDVTTGDQEHNKTNYRVPFLELSNDPQPLRGLYRVGRGGISEDKFESVVKVYGTIASIHANMPPPLVEKFTAGQIMALLELMNKDAEKYAERLMPPVEAYQIPIDSESKRRLKRALTKGNSTQNSIRLAYSTFNQYMTDKQSGRLKDDWLKAQPRGDWFNYFAGVNIKNPYSLIYRCIKHRNEQ